MPRDHIKPRTVPIKHWSQKKSQRKLVKVQIAGHHSPEVLIQSTQIFHKLPSQYNLDRSGLQTTLG